MHIVIVGGGFGGLYAAKALRRYTGQISLIDRRNFHLFQPLLYQVATGGISPGDIASPLRAVLAKQKNLQTLQGDVQDILPDQKRLILADGEIEYDALIIATGVHHHYFGREEWQPFAPGLKTVEDALEMRRRIFSAFERAERETDLIKRQAWMRFLVVGGGPTGVELAGALGELAHRTLRDDFRQIDPRQIEILLVEGQERILPAFPAALSAKAAAALQALGVDVRPHTLLTDLTKGNAAIKRGDKVERIETETVLWAAGVRASSLGKILGKRANAPLDRVGRVIVQADCRLPAFPDIFVIGDLAHYAHQTGEPLPGVAQVAMQQGNYVAKLLLGEARGKQMPAFRYRDKGNLAVIGRNKAVAHIGQFKFSGLPAWLIWIFIHIAYLIEFDNRLIVLIQWGMDYFTRKRGARLITNV